jgi:hypothetical protein
MRIIFIPGFGEDELCFSNLAPLIPGEKLVLNTWDIAGDQPRGNTDAHELAKELMGHYNITVNDLVIGHSMGGWIAYYLKHFTGCRIIQISSYTNPRRIYFPFENRLIIEGGVRSHIVFNPITRWLIVKLQYHHKPSEDFLKYVFNRIMRGNENNVINQLKVALTRVTLVPNVEPDLRIHSKGDLIVRPPKQPYYEVPGDHFSLYTHANFTAVAINNYIDNLKKQNLGV